MLGGNSGLVSSTMPQEADRGCAEICQHHPSGTTNNIKYKNKPGPVRQSICRYRKYPSEGVSRPKMLLLFCFYDSCIFTALKISLANINSIKS